jgi:hypothetical protein
MIEDISIILIARTDQISEAIDNLGRTRQNGWPEDPLLRNPPRKQPPEKNQKNKRNESEQN